MFEKIIKHGGKQYHIKCYTLFGNSLRCELSVENKVFRKKIASNPEEFDSIMEQFEIAITRRDSEKDFYLSPEFLVEKGFKREY